MYLPSERRYSGPPRRSIMQFARSGQNRTGAIEGAVPPGGGSAQRLGSRDGHAAPRAAAARAARHTALFAVLAACGASCAAPAGTTGPGGPAALVDPQLRIAPPSAIAPDFFGTRAVKLTATLMTAAGGSAAVPATALRWEVRDTSIAVIDSLGVLEARRIGRALVSASLTGRNPTATDSVLVDVVSPPRDTIAVVAHRGFALIAPENTLAAIDSAIDLGADAVEVDVVLTSDGVPVLMHDPTVDRTTDGSGAVSALTAAQVRALDACTWFGAGWAPCKVPTLDEALALAARRGGRLFLDLKGSYTSAQLGQLARQVRASGMHGRAMFISFDYRHLVALRAAEPSAPLGYLTHSLVAPEPLIALGATTALYSKVLLSAPSSSQHLDALRAAGVDVGVWTIVNAEEARALVARGVRRIITDVPLDRGALSAAR